MTATAEAVEPAPQAISLHMNYVADLVDLTAFQPAECLLRIAVGFEITTPQRCARDV